MGKVEVNVDGFIERNKSVIFGTMLGDASISDGKGRNTLLRVAHGVDQKDYLFHKYEIFKEVANPPRFYDRGEDGSFWNFNTVRHPAWQKVWAVFHENSRTKKLNGGRSYSPKVVNEKVLNALDDRGVAFWWMDDGNVSFHFNKETGQWREYAKLATCDFTIEENELMLSWFKRTYGACGTVSMQRVQKTERVYPLLYFSWQEFLKIVMRVSPFVPSCMSYKMEVQAAKLWMSKNLLDPHGLSVDNPIENVEERLKYGTGCGSYPA